MSSNNKIAQQIRDKIAELRKDQSAASTSKYRLSGLLRQGSLDKDQVEFGLDRLSLLKCHILCQQETGNYDENFEDLCANVQSELVSQGNCAILEEVGPKDLELLWSTSLAAVIKSIS